MIMPAGKISVKLNCVKGFTFNELSTVRVNVLGAPRLTAFGTKLFEKLGDVVTTFKSEEEFVLAPKSDIKILEVFVWTPKVEEVTLTSTKQVEDAGTEAPENVIVEPPFGAIKDAPDGITQVVTGLAKLESVTLAGKVLLKAKFSIAAPVTLLMVKTKCVLEPTPILLGKNPCEKFRLLPAAAINVANNNP
jgi:hypothetical protein